MGEIRGRGGCAAIIVGAVLILAAPPAVPQSLGGAGSQACSAVGGRVVCQPLYPSPGATGGHAYERWNDGSPAGAGAPGASHLPYNYGSYGTWYGFGR